MKFQKGNAGKPPGAKNKTSQQLRETISDFLTVNFQKIVRDFDSLQPRERAKLYCDLLQYGLPKLQSVTWGPDFERLSDDQLDQMINELKSHVENKLLNE